MEKIHIIFDLDGTLIDSRPEIESTYKKVCSEVIPEQPVNFDAINYGQTLPAILNFIYGEAQEKIAEAKNKFTELYDDSTFVNTTLYNGVGAVIAELHHSGYVMHIATNKRLTPTLKILKVKGLFPYFTGIITSDKIQGQIISKQQMVNTLCREFEIKKGYMVGDGDQDIEAGNLCGLLSVAAVYGYEKKEVLLKKNPKFVINQFTELTTVLSKNI